MPTKIPWSDETWNPFSGCSGPTGTLERPRPCPYCYAARKAARLARFPHTAYKYRNVFRPTFHPEEIDKFWDKAKKWRKPRRVFVGSMGDIMDPGFSDDEIRQQIQVAADFPAHTFLFLTKRPTRYAHFEWPDNAWLGATATDQRMASRAMEAFQGLEAEITFLSCEPLLGPLDLWYMPEWVIIGSMTGPNAEPPKRRWVYDLIQQAEGRAAVFCKDNLEPHFGNAFIRRDFPR